MLFDAREATVDSVHQAIYSGLSSCREVVSAFIARIEAHNDRTNAIISLNPNALATADLKDKALQAGTATGPLFGVPVLLKDNFDTVEMPTTGGCLALKGSRPTVDAPTVVALKKAGAIILGKANLHELALEGISVSSLGGQTINPYDSTRTPGGSSGGTGAAIAASFAVLGTGTDTVNSLRSPASANSLFSIRPTRGLITRTGVIPVSNTQDAVGPIARTIKDVAIALTVMCTPGFDPEDNITATVPLPVRNIDYAANLSRSNLINLRFGVLNTFFDRTSSSETDPVNAAMDAYTRKIAAAGGILVPINEPVYNAALIQSVRDVQRYEYCRSMDKYLSRPSLSGIHPDCLRDLYSFKSIDPSDGDFLVLPSQYEFIKDALTSSTRDAQYMARKQSIEALTRMLHSTFAASHLDAIIYPEQKNLVVKLGSRSQSGRNGTLAALTGFPVVTVPVGFSDPTDDAPIGVPIGMEIMGRPWEEEKLLKIGAAMERLGCVRRAPVWAGEVLEEKSYERVPFIEPDRGNVPEEYPLGTW